MSIYPEKYGFVYIWYDRKHKRYYIGSHWGTEDDGYVCSSNWMYKTYKRRPEDFKRRIIKRIYTDRLDLLAEEDRYLGMIKSEEMAKHTKDRDKTRYYNLHASVKVPWHATDDGIKTVGEKISKANKGKKFGPRDPSVGQKISETKKAKFEERQQRLGYKFSDEHREKLAAGRRDKPHTEEWKLENGRRTKEQWALNTRRRQAVSEAAKKRWEEYRKKKQEQLAI